MTIAIMQPYIFPYLGYFQLIQESDLFIIYDDVNFIKQGWINRNRILCNGKDLLFTIPIQKISSNILIEDVEISQKEYLRWRKKFLKSIKQNYQKAPEFDFTYPLLEEILSSPIQSIAELALLALTRISEALKITTILKSSKVYSNKHLKGQDRVLDICKIENATTYINAIGGKTLYSSEAFERQNIALLFLQPCLQEYSQFSHPFVSGLSIIDVMMFNPIGIINKFLNNYQLISN